MAVTAVDARRSLPRRWPVVVPLVLFAAALILRIIDIFVLGLDERLGEIIVSKALALILCSG